MKDTHVIAPSGDETDSWVYTYTDECAAPSMEGCACKVVKTPKYHSAVAQDSLHNYFQEQNILEVDKREVEVEAIGQLVYMKLWQEGAPENVAQVALNLRQACLLMRMLAVAIGEVSATKARQES